MPHELRRCVGCGGWFPDIEGPTHRYMEAAPGCWAAFGEVLAHEYSNPIYNEVHRLTVDAYAVQHPGHPSRQSIQSVGVHLIRLCLFFEHGLAAEDANDALLAAAQAKHTFFWLEPPESVGSVTVAEVARAQTADERKAAVRAWASSTWDAWSGHHETIRAWVPQRYKWSKPN